MRTKVARTSSTVKFEDIPRDVDRIIAQFAGIKAYSIMSRVSRRYYSASKKFRVKNVSYVDEMLAEPMDSPPSWLLHDGRIVRSEDTRRTFELYKDPLWRPALNAPPSAAEYESYLKANPLLDRSKTRLNYNDVSNMSVRHLKVFITANADHIKYISPYIMLCRPLRIRNLLERFDIFMGLKTDRTLTEGMMKAALGYPKVFLKYRTFPLPKLVWVELCLPVLFNRYRPHLEEFMLNDETWKDTNFYCVAHTSGLVPITDEDFEERYIAHTLMYRHMARNINNVDRLALPNHKKHYMKKAIAMSWVIKILDRLSNFDLEIGKFYRRPDKTVENWLRIFEIGIPECILATIYSLLVTGFGSCLLADMVKNALSSTNFVGLRYPTTRFGVAMALIRETHPMSMQCLCLIAIRAPWYRNEFQCLVSEAESVVQKVGSGEGSDFYGAKLAALKSCIDNPNIAIV